MVLFSTKRKSEYTANPSLEVKNMNPEFEINKKDVIEIITKQKTEHPWGNYPNEQYTYIIYWEDGIIRMAVNEFYEVDTETYCICRYYTAIVANSMEEFKAIPEEKLASIAYNAWCSGAR